jgi:hypothetical protein
MLVEWSVRKGRDAVFADCGLGKTFIQLTWAENVARKTSGRVLVLTPLAVSFQTVAEGAKIGVEVNHRRDGIKTGDRIVVTNYERLHRFNPDDFTGVVCDESSILKNFDGETRKAITDFMRKRPYRLLCTATAAPNDYIELGTSSEAIGEMGYADMLSRFFKRDQKFFRAENAGGQGWRMRGHAERDFWRWVCSWARAIRKPSDAGFDDGAFTLPSLNIRQHTVEARTVADGYLFDLPAVGLNEQRAELKRTINERCEMVADVINAHHSPAIAWCHLIAEGNLIKRLIPDAVEISGSDSDERKEEVFSSFMAGNIRVLVTKPTIAGFGLNFQHCSHLTFFPSHSYEQYYQAVRRCWRFGQKNPVTVDLITTEGQNNVLKNLQRKAESADRMFSQLVAMMWRELKIENTYEYERKAEIPSWVLQNRLSRIDTPYIAATA